MAFKLHPQAKTKGKIEITDKKITTGECRLSYPVLFEAKTYKGKTSWSASFIFSKDQDLTPLEVVAQNAAIDKWGSDTTKWPSKKVKSKKTGNLIDKSLVAMPFKDGDIDKPEDEAYANSIYFTASNKKNAPIVLNQKKTPITKGGIKAGDWVRASLIAFAYEAEGSFGVSFALQGVQKLRTGEALGSGGNAANDFSEVEMEEGEVDDAADFASEDAEY